jgi:hypothetical protein
MTNDQIVENAVKAEAEKQHAIDADLIAVALNGATIAVVDGEVVGVTELVRKLRKEKPHLFKEQDASKLKAAEFDALEAELREPQHGRASHTLPAWVRKIDAFELSNAETDALSAVLAGSKAGHYHGIVEGAARRQGIDVAAASA